MKEIFSLSVCWWISSYKIVSSHKVCLPVNRVTLQSVYKQESCHVKFSNEQIKLSSLFQKTEVQSKLYHEIIDINKAYQSVQENFHSITQKSTPQMLTVLINECLLFGFLITLVFSQLQFYSILYSGYCMKPLLTNQGKKNYFVCIRNAPSYVSMGSSKNLRRNSTK